MIDTIAGMIVYMLFSMIYMYFLITGVLYFYIIYNNLNSDLYSDLYSDILDNYILAD